MYGNNGIFNTHICMKKKTRDRFIMCVSFIILQPMSLYICLVSFVCSSLSGVYNLFIMPICTPSGHHMAETLDAVDGLLGGCVAVLLCPVLLGAPSAVSIIDSLLLQMCVWGVMKVLNNPLILYIS